MVWLWFGSDLALIHLGSGPRGEPGSTREAREALGKPRDAPGTPQERLEMSGASFRKIGFFGSGRRLAAQEQLRNEQREFREIVFFGPGRRLAAPEGPKIAGGVSLARREQPD